MLTLKLMATDEAAECEIQLEHSLVSLSKWESFYEKPFYDKAEKQPDEMMSYVEMMMLSPDFPADWFARLKTTDLHTISDYINSKQTATWFTEDKNARAGREIVTAELIYSWMITYKIPFTCETWHINRLMTLIRICSLQQQKPKRMSKQAQAEQMRRLNEQRRQQLGTTG